MSSDTVARDNRIRVLVVDDHPLLREGIAAVLGIEPDMELVGQATSGQEALALIGPLRPDVTLMDLQMPGLGGLETIGLIRKERPTHRILVLTTYGGDAHAYRALKAGAVGFMLKSALHRELLDAIRTVHAGRRYVPSAIADEIFAHLSSELLSERELEVLRLVATGEANKGVARQLGISEQTVKAHLKNIFAKLEVTDRTMAVTVSARRGIIDL